MFGIPLSGTIPGSGKEFQTGTSTAPIAEPAGDIFPAIITSIGSVVGATGAGTGYTPHGWSELRINTASRAYIIDEMGRSGTATIGGRPAYAINGGTVAVGTIVFLRLRGIISPDQERVYDIVCC